ncbi:MAG: TetR/AcrR family transcriptional regulator [Frankiales bacterium]|nr:TetR/AcrR family transcriptional regulator [Frankiales bacterium]
MSKSVTVATTRELLLDAAYDAALAGDWERVRMADVARAAGVSRQTLYYEFGSKDKVAEAVALREAARWIAGAEAAVVGHEGSPSEAIAAGTQWTLEEAERNPLLKAVLTDDVGGLLPYLTTRAELLQTAARDHCAQHLSAHWPGIATERVRLVADTVTRMQFSHLLLPGGRPEQVAHDIALLVDALLSEEGPA